MSSSPIKPSSIEGNVSPRPASPAEEADEVLTPSEDDEYKKIATQGRRKSSVWKKALNIRKQISKMKISDGVRRPSIFFSQADESNLSPVEISPESVEDAPAKSEYVQHLESEVLQSMSDLEMAMESHRSPEKEKAVQPEQGPEEGAESDSKRQQNAKADDDSAAAVGSMPRDTIHCRPMNLPLFDENGQPIVPPRAHKSDARNQRLLSVPNIKYNRTTGDISRARVKKDSTTTFAGTFMRKFSKYWKKISHSLLENKNTYPTPLSARI